MIAQPARPSGVATSIAAAVDALPLVLVALAEAAWISVVAGLVQEFALQSRSVALPVLLGFVAVGVVTSQLLGPRLGERWPFAALGIAFAGGVAGWLVPGEVRAALAAGDLRLAMSTNPGGWLAGFAVVRGFAHADRPLEEATVARLLAYGMPGLAFTAALGGMVAEPWRSQFLRDALGASIVYAAAGTLGLAFVRLGTEGHATLGWRRNPVWAVLLCVLIAGAIWIAIPGASMTGTLLAWLVGLAIAPLLVLGLIATFQARNRRLVAVTFAIAAVIVMIVQIVKPAPPGGGGSGGAGGPASDVLGQLDPVVAVGLGGIGLLLFALVVLVLARLWMRTAEAPSGDVGETRSIDVSPVTREHPAAQRRHRRRATDPHDAVTAYTALIADIAANPDVGREDAETPLAHARRMRESGRTGPPALALDLLAADYALARFGGRSLTAVEDRRAVGRWRRLRRSLMREPEARFTK